MDQAQTEKELLDLSNDIAACRKCDESGIRVLHAPPMTRGAISPIMVIGIEPGKNELKTAIAFSGPAGKRLKGWLKQVGLGDGDDEIFARTYFTSLCKCNNKKSSTIAKAARNCFPFLQRQINLIRPRLVLTLGIEPISQLFDFSGKLDDIVGKAYFEHDLLTTFLPIFPESTQIVPLPHPSPLSRWLNDEVNQLRLENALSEVKTILADW